MLHSSVLPYQTVVGLLFIMLTAAVVACCDRATDEKEVARDAVGADSARGLELTGTSLKISDEDWSKLEKVCMFVSGEHETSFRVNRKSCNSLDSALAEMKLQLQEQGRSKVFFTHGKGCSDEIRNSVRQVCIDSNLDLFCETAVSGLSLGPDAFRRRWVVMRVGPSK